MDIGAGELSQSTEILRLSLISHPCMGGNIHQCTNCPPCPWLPLPDLKIEDDSRRVSSTAAQHLPPGRPTPSRSPSPPRAS
jgi:hypothetical protein